MYGIIGGSGLLRLDELQSPREMALSTPYGETSGPLTIGAMRSAESSRATEVVFLPRHGYGHTIAPHRINYRANIWALKKAGVRKIIGVASVGGIRSDLLPGCLVVPDQLVDYTWGRDCTFCDISSPLLHVDFTQPFSEGVRAEILSAARACGLTVLDGAVYAVTQGPRLETAGEINRIERDGGHVVGMTGMPEAALARELGLEYASLAIVVNHAAGRGASRHGIDMTEVGRILDNAMARVKILLQQLVAS